MKKINTIAVGTMFAAALMAGNGMNAFAAEADPDDQVIEAEAAEYSEENDAETVCDPVIENDNRDDTETVCEFVVENDDAETVYDIVIENDDRDDADTVYVSVIENDDRDDADAVYDYVIENDNQDEGGVAVPTEAVITQTPAPTLKPVTSYFMPDSSVTHEPAEAVPTQTPAPTLKPVTSYFMPDPSVVHEKPVQITDEDEEEEFDEEFDDEEFDEEFEDEDFDDEVVVDVAYGGGINIEQLVPGVVGDQTETGGYGSRDQEINAAINQALEVPEYQKSEWTKYFEKLAAEYDPIAKKASDELVKEIDKADLPEFEKEAAKNGAKLVTGFATGTAYALVTPGYGAGKKLFESLAYFSKVNDAQKGTAKFYNALKGIQKAAEGAVTFVPGGGEFVKGLNIAETFATYAIKRIGSFFYK